MQKKTKAIVTAENHNVIGGLGSAVAEVLSEHCPTPLRRIGVKEQFGQVGKADYLKGFYQLTAKDIVAAVKELI
ncbi:transketolase C-terminal domain-containing protein [Metabacillus sediminilitoris]|uniref:transketolase C-terminal domain-containing protein n=1 Tax=Metabacillus sediminilitoris TaxID=2567941 RepID=UPI0022A6A792|nr:transketolase C-terminal domain-containing protein [Metabacillus sediminilitoris]